MRRARRLPDAAIALGIFLLNFALNSPMFMRGDSPYRDSIEGGYAAMARFIAAHPNPWGWNPTQYCGLPTQFLYLPGMPYASAAVVWLTGLPPEYAYRLIAVTLACLGPATLFLFARFFTGSRSWALAAALGYTFFSPLYGLVRQIDKDRGGIAQLPWRMQVLAKYGEGPHNAGLTLMPLALMAAWAAGVYRRYANLLLAAALLAAVALINWVAALALALCCLLLLACAPAGERPLSAGWVLASAGLAYLLACFWLTPSFIGTIAFNWPKDAFGYRLSLTKYFSAAALAAVLCAARAVLPRLCRGFYFTFVNMAALLFGWIAFGHYWFGTDVIPESRRYAVEFEFFLMLALAGWLSVLWKHRPKLAAAAAAVLILPGLPQAWTYLTQDRAIRAPWPLAATPEYPMAEFLARQNPSGRVFATGGLRFRLNSWFDVPQLSGGFESGLDNRRPVDVYYQVRTGSASFGRGLKDTLTQLRAMGVQYIAVHGPGSREHYKDFANPRQFEGVLPKVYDRDDNVIYALPPVSLAHLVRREELARWHKPPHLDAYAAAVDDASRPALQAEWHGPSALTVAGPVPAGMLISVQVSGDPGWTAYQDGSRLRIEEDLLGFMVLEARPAALARIELRYEGTTEQRLMAGLSALAWAAALAGVFLRRRIGPPAHDPVRIVQST
ncbi:MAG: hypothetical protein ACE15B_10935 [Bryobacteraceae bacterium]